VRRSFSVRSETKRKGREKLFALKRKNAVFSLVSLRSEKLEIENEQSEISKAKRKRTKKSKGKKEKML
jgi:hypothetical protein